MPVTPEQARAARAEADARAAAPSLFQLFQRIDDQILHGRGSSVGWVVHINGVSEDAIRAAIETYGAAGWKVTRTVARLIFEAP